MKLPRCPDYYTPGCPDCQAYANTNRHRRRGWEPRKSTAQVRAHIEQLRQTGMSYKAIADRSGVSKRSVYDIHVDHNRTVSQVLGEAILGVQPRLSRTCLVPSIGVARRLQALTCIGWGARMLGTLLGEEHCVIQRWRSGLRPQIRWEHHVQVNAAYQRILLEIGDGRSRVAINRAKVLGYQPPDAWSDETIDDPDAQPYQHLADEQDIDLVKVARVRDHQTVDGVTYQFTDLNWAEQQYLFHWFVTKTGASARTFRDRYRPVPAAVLRDLEASVEGLRMAG